MDHHCPWPTDGWPNTWHCHHKEQPMTAYRDRMNAGEYDVKDTASKAKAQKAAATRAAKSTTTKRSSK